MSAWSGSNLRRFPSEHAGVPNALLQSSLFRAVQARGGSTCTRTVRSLGGTRLVWSGEPLNQSHLSALMAVVRCAQGAAADVPIELRDVDLLKTLYLHAGTKDRTWIRGLLTAMTAPIEWSQRKSTYVGPLLNVSLHDRGRMTVIFSRQFCAAYAGNYTRLRFADRRENSGAPLALWIAALYATRPILYPMHVETIYELCGSENRSVRSFRRDLERSLNLVQERKGIESWEYDEDGLIAVCPVLTEAERKQVAKKAAAKIENRPAGESNKTAVDDLGSGVNKSTGCKLVDEVVALNRAWLARPLPDDFEDDIPFD